MAHNYSNVPGGINMEKKSVAFCALLGVSVIAAGLLVGANLEGEANPTLSESVSYQLQVGSYSEITGGAKTTSGYGISFAYSGLSDSSGVGTLASGGYIYNTTQISGITKVDVTLASGSVTIAYGKTDTASWSEGVSASSYDLSGILPNYFKITASSDAVISKIAVKYQCYDYQAASASAPKVYVNGVESDSTWVVFPDANYDNQYKITLDVYKGDVITFYGVYPNASGDGNNAERYQASDKDYLIVKNTQLSADLYLKEKDSSYDVWLTGYGNSFAESSMQDGNILQAWNWTLANIRSNLQNIADAGYGAVQISPLQCHENTSTSNAWGSEWWKLYQPYSLSIATTSTESAIGTKSELTALCQEASAIGVNVIVDVVVNHLGGSDYKTFDSYVNTHESEIYSNGLKHNYGQISDWNDQQQLLTYSQGSYPDLMTEDMRVQARALSLLKEYLDCGVTGFRFDAAKHIETPRDGAYASSFWPYVVNGAKRYANQKGYDVPYCYGEILGVGNNRSLNWYTTYMSITEGSNPDNLRTGVNNGDISKISGDYYAGLTADKYVLWAESHDEYKNNTTSSMGETNINKVYAIQGSRSEATALYLARPNDSSTKMGSVGNTWWKDNTVAAVNKFHSRFAGNSEYIEVNNDNNATFVNVRGSGSESGAVIVNIGNGNSSYSVHLPNMDDGIYVDLVTNKQYTVSGNYATVSFTDGICVLSPIAGVPTYYLVGNTIFTGTSESWNVASGLEMVKAGDNIAQIEGVEIKENAEVKVVRAQDDEITQWYDVTLGGSYAYCEKSGTNLKFTADGLYNIYLNSEAKYFVTQVSGDEETPIATSTTKTISITINIDWWNDYNAKTYVYYWGGSSSTNWPGVPADGSGTSYTIDVPIDTTYVIVVRLNPNDLLSSGVWNQTKDIELSGNSVTISSSDVKSTSK